MHADGSTPTNENNLGEMNQYITLDSGIVDLDLINLYYLMNKNDNKVIQSLSNIWIQILFQLLLTLECGSRDL